MHHFFVCKEQIGQDAVTVVGSDVNHIRNVLRMRCGEEVGISDGVNKEYRCEITQFNAESITLRILSENETGAELPAKLYLFQGLPKNDKMDLIVQKAVELGVYKIIPVETARTVVKLDAKKKETRIKRWNLIAESAAKQSGRILVPEVSGVMTLNEAYAYSKNLDVRLIPYELAKGMAETKKEIEKVQPGVSVGVFIGPEGGFEETEVLQATEAGIIPITLGKRILRTETAGLAMLSVLMFRLES